MFSTDSASSRVPEKPEDVVFSVVAEVNDFGGGINPVSSTSCSFHSNLKEKKQNVL